MRVEEALAVVAAQAVRADTIDSLGKPRVGRPTCHDLARFGPAVAIRRLQLGRVAPVLLRCCDKLAQLLR